ncbi:MAG TPA: hypothetical protein VKV96_20680 [Roseiarcus sp.]|nr:hypothetical protein [Roseiarcus sp.]
MNRALKELVERAETWPETAQAELVEIAREIEGELAGSYAATAEELRALDEALASVERGEIASEAAVEAVLAKYRRV